MKTIAKDELYEALALLEEAAKDAAVEIWTLIRDQYPNLQKMLLDDVDYVRDSINTMEERLKQKAHQIKETTGKKVRYAVSQVDEDIHHHPWSYMGAIAVSSLLLGYILGRKM